MSIPILGLAGYSGSGKTTVLETLIPLLRAGGLRLAVLKHDGHSFDIDHPGKDSARFSSAGAEMVILTSKEKTAVIENRELSLEESLGFIHDVDLILVEGFKYAAIPQIGICRKANAKGLPGDPNRYLALVTDMPEYKGTIPCFSFEDTKELANLILQWVDSKII